MADLFVAMPDGRRPGGGASRRVYDRNPIARLHAGVTIAQAQDRLTPILQQIDREHPLFDRVRRADLLSLRQLWFGASRPLLWLLAAAAGFVMLVTAANATGLMSVIASRRSREFAVRSALGASPHRLLGQSLVEMAAIAAASWMTAGVLAIGLTRAFAWLAPRDIPRITGLHVDWRGWCFAAAVTAILCLLLGLMPAWLHRRRDVINALHGGLAFTPPRRTWHWRSTRRSRAMPHRCRCASSTGHRSSYRPSSSAMAFSTRWVHHCSPAATFVRPTTPPGPLPSSTSDSL
jgi:putative ABC transport system permease protein